MTIAKSLSIDPSNGSTDTADEVKEVVNGIVDEAAEKSGLMHFLHQQWMKVCTGLNGHNTNALVRGFVQFLVAVCMFFVAHLILAITSGVFGAALALLVMVSAFILLIELAWRLALRVSEALFGSSALA